jgi:hypothetical protein
MSRSKSSFPLVGVALDGPVRRKRNNAGKIAAKAKIKRVVEGATEVMVKVTGGVSGGKTHLKAHLDYISRNGKIDLENERGEIIDTRERLREEHKQWCDELGVPRKNQRDTINIVLSMPASTAPEAVKRAAREFAKENFSGNHQYVMALHHPGNDAETKQPHVHLTVKARGYDGAKLDPKKTDLQDWRESFAEKMRQHGYNAEATPRRSRGVVMKATRHVVRAIAEDKKRPGRGLVMKEKLKEAADALAGRPVSENPARKQIVAKQQEIRKAWLGGAEELEKSADPEDKALATSIRRFVAAMPKELKDERETLKDLLRAEIESARQQKKETGLKAPVVQPEKDRKDDLER